MRHTSWHVVGAAASVLALNACGSGALSKPEYAAQVRPLCEEAGKTNAVILEQLYSLDLKNKAGLREAVEKLRSAGEAQSQRVEEIAALEPPEADRERLESALIAPLRAQRESGNRLLEGVEAFIETGNTDGLEYQEPISGDPVFLQEYGLNDCASLVEGEG